MVNEIHLDCISSREMRQVAKDTIIQNINKIGNTTANYRKGHIAANIIDNSRIQISEALKIDDKDCIHFTSGPEESANWAIKGLAWKFGKKRNKFVCPETESIRIRNPINWLKKYGYGSREIKIISEETITLDHENLKEAMDKNINAVCIEYANSELGFVNNIKAVTEIVSDYSPSAKIVCDLSTQIGRGVLDVDDLGIDLGIMDSQSFGGPSGLGALYVNPDLKIENLIHGDHSEFGKRAGIQNVAMISAMGFAAKEMSNSLENEIEHLSNITRKTNDYLKVIGNYKINTPPYQLTHGIMNYIPGPISSEIVVQEVSEKGYSIAHSGGCSNVNGLPSRVLKAIGLSDDDALSSIKLSYDHNTNWPDVENCIKLIEGIVEKKTA